MKFIEKLLLHDIFTKNCQQYFHKIVRTLYG